MLVTAIVATTATIVVIFHVLIVMRMVAARTPVKIVRGISVLTARAILAARKFVRMLPAVLRTLRHAPAMPVVSHYILAERVVDTDVLMAVVLHYILANRVVDTDALSTGPDALTLVVDTR